MDPPSALQIEKHSRFNVFTTSYKTINDHAITLDVLIPKQPSSGKHPLIVKIHGGALVCTPCYSSLSTPG
jgi:cephalosporin-C deacetylase-like acetyl esterase